MWFLLSFLSQPFSSPSFFISFTSEGRIHLIWKNAHPNPSLCHVTLELQCTLSICSKTSELVNWSTLWWGNSLPLLLLSCVLFVLAWLLDIWCFKLFSEYVLVYVSQFVFSFPDFSGPHINQLTTWDFESHWFQGQLEGNLKIIWVTFFFCFRRKEMQFPLWSLCSWRHPWSGICKVLSNGFC